MNNCFDVETRPTNPCGGGNAQSRVCADGARYVQRELKNPPKRAIMSCEGGCIKGEVARIAANILAYQLERDNSIRICLGDAATGDSGFFELVKRATEVIVIEGCPLQCGTEIMRMRTKEFSPTIINASELYSFDRCEYFEIFSMPREQLEEHAAKVAEYVKKNYFK